MKDSNQKLQYDAPEVLRVLVCPGMNFLQTGSVEPGHDSGGGSYAPRLGEEYIL